MADGGDVCLSSGRGERRGGMGGRRVDSERRKITRRTVVCPAVACTHYARNRASFNT